MTKKRSKRLIILLSIILFIGLLASFVSFTYPFKVGGVYYKYSSFVHELVLGGDINGGVVVEYTATMPDNESTKYYDEYLNNTLTKMRNVLESAGYKDSSVTSFGENGIRVEVGNVADYTERQNVLTLIGNPEHFKLSTSSSADDTSKVFLTSKYVKTVEPMEQAGSVGSVWYANIVFTKEGKQILAEKTAEIAKNGETMYMFLGDTAVSSNTLESAITTGELPMTSDNFVDYKSTLNYCNQLKAGLFDLKLTQTSSDTISPLYGNHTMVYIYIAMAVLLIAVAIFLCYRYRFIGGMAVFNMLFFVVISLFLLQSIPFMHINLSGVFAMMLAVVFAVDALVIILEYTKSEYEKGKKLNGCFKLGMKKALVPILTSNILLCIAGGICALMPNMAIQSFGMVSFVLSFVNVFCSLILFRLIIKLYLPFNFYDGEKCGFKRLEEGK